MKPETSDKQRVDFEKWITASPFNCRIVRFPNDPKKYAWPDGYMDLSTALAWESWKESRSHLERELKLSSDPLK